MRNSDMPAYPHVDADGHAGLLGDGLTKREYFAGLAMQALVGGGLPPEYTAPRALEFADAILLGLEKTK